MSTYYRKRNHILLEDGKTILERFAYINEAKRESRKLQKAGNSVFVIRREGGRK